MTTQPDGDVGFPEESCRVVAERSCREQTGLSCIFCQGVAWSIGAKPAFSPCGCECHERNELDPPISARIATALAAEAIRDSLGRDYLVGLEIAMIGSGVRNGSDGGK
jgi:hypothetical protein